MTKEQVKQQELELAKWKALHDAMNRGEIIQTRTKNEGWKDESYLDWNCPIECYRIKPTIAYYRPWKVEEIPIGCIVRSKKRADEFNEFMLVEMVVGRTETNVYIGHGNSLKLIELFDRYEHSIDNGKTWLPCGILNS